MPIRSTLVFTLLVILARTSSAQLLETLTVPAGDEDGVISSTSLPSGQLFELAASGSVFISGSRVADSEYADFDDEAMIQDVLNSTDIGMAIDGIDIDWGDYSADNTYTASYIGTGSPLTALFRDTLYVDNRGELTLSITQVPEPSSHSLLMLALVGLMAMRRKFLRIRSSM